LGRNHKSESDIAIIGIKDITGALSDFFEIYAIRNALKQMIFAGVITETAIGSRALKRGENWRDVILEIEHPEGSVECAQFSCSYDSTAMFYLYELLCEYEYIYQMALAYGSCWLGTSTFERSSSLIEESIVLRFLDSFLEITEKNLQSYKENGVFQKYMEYFTDGYKDYIDSSASNKIKTGMYPWSRMTLNYIKVLKHKINLAKSEGSTRYESLVELLNQAKALLERGEKYFESLES
jgi:hypothetical protein